MLFVWLVLQVLYYCPGLREGIKKLYNLSKQKDDLKEETDSKEVGEKQMLNYTLVFLFLPKHLIYNMNYSSMIIYLTFYFF